jgi:glyoxylase-like metal-dependent hydrolase (beta-lactamase superfamily II)
MKRMVLLAGLLAAGAVSLAVTKGRTQQNVAGIEKVRDNLYMITGGGGNTAAFITEKGVVVVDTKLRGWGNAILDKIKSVTDKPVTTIINTHTHGDHTGSNAEFPASVEVIAHENCKASMEKMPPFQTEEGKKFLPKRTYKDKTSLLSGKEKIDLYYFGAGHTDGDTIIVFPALKVAHTGDLFAAKGAPLIDVRNGGSGVAYGKTTMKAASEIRGVETVIPGHSPVTDWKTFQQFAEFNRDFLAVVEQAHKDGKTAEEAAASLKLAEKYPGFNMGRAAANVTAIYSELKK